MGFDLRLDGMVRRAMTTAGSQGTARSEPMVQSERERELEAITVGPVRRLPGRRIVIVDYDPAWPALFEREDLRIRAALGDRALLVEHAGSTAVPGLAAKPRIDVILAVPDSADEPSYVPDLEAAGYVLALREPDWFEHRVFKGPDADMNLHTFTIGSPEIDKMLLFRDWLRAHDDERELYQRAKLDLASREWEFTQDYADAKTDVVHGILARAGWQPPAA
jgi:GrpB-like predicted nucleotidyltransferase (UPF0157 family)